MAGMHQRPVIESEFGHVEPRECVCETVFEKLEQGVGRRVAGPLQFDKARGLTGEMDEIDCPSCSRHGKNAQISWTVFRFKFLAQLTRPFSRPAISGESSL